MDSGTPQPSLYTPGLDDHIEEQRVYHNDFLETYFRFPPKRSFAKVVNSVTKLRAAAPRPMIPFSEQ